MTSFGVTGSETAEASVAGDASLEKKPRGGVGMLIDSTVCPFTGAASCFFPFTGVENGVPCRTRGLLFTGVTGVRGRLLRFFFGVE